MTQSTNELPVAEYGTCEGCEKPEFLEVVEGHGKLCMACECDLICSDIEETIRKARA